MKLIITTIAIFALVTLGQAQNWETSGNTITDPLTEYLGTNNAQPLVFKTNKFEAIRVSATGNLGIGTNNPTNKLHVAGGSGSSLRLANTLNASSLGTNANGDVIVNNFVLNTVGAIKFAMISANHDGWYRMDGGTYASNGLTAAAISNANSIGLAGNLPDARDKYLSQVTAGALNTSSGDLDFLKQILKTDLPNIDITADTEGATITGPNVNYPKAGLVTNGQFGLIEISNGGNETVILVDETLGEVHLYGGTKHHNHDYQTDTLNGLVSGQTDINIKPRTIKAIAFIYLGQ